MTEVRTRVAPSPTGIVHVGTGYISLFNWAFAKKNKGKFFLRLEDTDVKRHIKGAEEVIEEGLNWLGLVPDENYKQSQRLDIYRKKAKELLDKGLVYEEEGAIRFKNPGNDLTFKDLVRGEITFPGSEVTDFVIVRSDGMPLYNFVVVVDDIEMKISHIIRGEEHISNTPRQLALYKAFGVTPPEIAHIPLLRNPDRSKISKRKNPVSLLWYRDEGYLPEALLNFFALLGWSHPEGKEVFDVEEFARVFDFDHVHKTGPIFDFAKLDWINKQWLMRKTPKEFVSFVSNASVYRNNREFGNVALETVSIVQPRVSNIREYDNLIGPMFEDPEVDKDLFGKKHKEHLSSSLKALKTVDWKKEDIESALMSVIEENGYKTGDFFMDLRIALWGRKVTPPLTDMLAKLDRKIAIDRLEKHI